MNSKAGFQVHPVLTRRLASELLKGFSKGLLASETTLLGNAQQGKPIAPGLLQAALYRLDPQVIDPVIKVAVRTALPNGLR